MMNKKEYLAMNKSITLTMEEWHTIAHALQIAFYSDREQAEERKSEHYAKQAEKCWNLFCKSSEWFPDENE